MKFEVGKKYKWRETGAILECVFRTSLDACLKREDLGLMVFTLDQLSSEFREIREPREWIIGLADPNSNQLTWTGDSLVCGAPVKVREVLE